MIKITELKNLLQGQCLVIGHGESINKIKWEKIAHIPKILVNFYDPLIANVMGIVCWDKDIMKEVHQQREFYYDFKRIYPLIFYSGCEIEQKADVFLDPKTFVPSTHPVFSGARAIYLSQYLGYNEILLIGFDFIPHTSKNYMVQQKEIDNPSDINKSLQVQMDCFQHIDWIHNNVFQTNKDSRLTYFKQEQLNGN